MRSKILKVEYSRTYKSYVVDYHPAQNATQTLQEKLGPILELLRGGDWFISDYETAIISKI